MNPTKHPSLSILAIVLCSCGGVEQETTTTDELFGGDDPADCDDGNPCTDDITIGRGCRHTVKPNGSSCSDGNACNGEETCYFGECRAGGNLNCNDGNECTFDYCDPKSGCYHVQRQGECDDGNACTVGDSCATGVCRGFGSTSGPISVPAIDNVEISAPPGSELLARPPIYYLEGRNLDIRFVVPSCSYVTHVTYGLRTLRSTPGTSCDEIADEWNCEPNYYSIERDVLLPTGERDLTIRLQLLEAPGTGEAIPVTVVVESALGETGYDFTLSRVAEVNPNHYPLTFGEEEIHNRIIAATFERFGDDGVDEVCENDPCQPGDDVKVAYGPNYNRTFAYVDTAGVHFQIQFKADAELCDPTITVRGSFIIDPQTFEPIFNSFDPLSVDFDFGNCKYIPGLSHYERAEAARSRGMIERTIRNALEDGLRDLVGDCSGSCSMAIGAIEFLDGEVRVRLLPAFPAVAINVPYSPSRLQSPASSGLPLNAGEFALITAANLVAACDSPTSIQSQCWGQRIGPNGIFNWFLEEGPGAPPVPAPDPTIDGTERWEARQALAGIGRSKSSLPRPELEVGRLLGRLASVPTNALSRDVGAGGCEFRTTVSDHLVFGPNDRTHATLKYGFGTQRVTVAFAPESVTNLCGLPRPDSADVGGDPGGIPIGR